MPCVYKIYCKDTDITDEYVGSCKDIYKRIHNHKSHTKTKKKSCAIHNFIRENGGWDNWDYKILELCDDDMRTKEQEYIDLLKPSLNTRKALGDKKEYDREWWSKHKEYSARRRTDFVKRNPDKIKAYYSKKVVCDKCGLELTQGSLNRHNKRKHNSIIL
jgi:group I intron endonuclease